MVHAGNKIDSGSNVTSSEDHMTMNFMMGETAVTLELERNEDVPQLATYYTVEHGKLVQWTLDHDEQVTHELIILITIMV